MARLVRSFALGFAAGLERYFWYSWDNRWMGVAEDEGVRNGPAVRGWSRSVQWLEGTRLIGCGSSNKTLWACELIRDGTRRGWMVWNISGPVYWQVPKAWGAVSFAELTDAVANTISAGAVDVGPTPILITADTAPWGN